MFNKIKLVLLVCFCGIILACSNGINGGKIVYETEDKKIKIYEAEVNYELDRALEIAGITKADISEDKLEEMKIKIIQSLALTRAIALEGKNQNLNKSKIYKDGIDNAKETLLAEVTINERSKNIDISENRLREFYEKNKSKFERKEDAVRLQLIVVGLDEIDKAKKGLEEALKDSENFGEIVKKYSSSKDEANGETGEIPLTVLETEYPQINEVIKNVEKNQIVNKVVIVGNEAYVIKVLEKLPKGFIEFDKVKKNIYNQVVIQEREEKGQNFIREVKEKYKLNDINKDTVNLSE